MNPRHGVLLALLLLALGMPLSADGQARKEGFGFSAEFGIGGSSAGHGGGVAGKVAMRVHPGSGPWALGVRFIVADGDRRGTTGCWFSPCEALESLTEKAVLLYRKIPTSDGGGAFYLGAGLGHLSGRQFIGSTSELEQVSELGLSLEAALHAPARGLRLVMAANGHIGSSRPMIGATIGIGFGR